MKTKFYFLLPLLIACGCNSAPSSQNTTSGQVKPIEELIVGTWQSEKDGAEVAFYKDKIFTAKDAKGAKDGTYTIIPSSKMIELQVNGKEKVQSEIISLTESDLTLKEGSATTSYKRGA